MANRVELVVAGSNQTQGALDAANREVQRFSNDVERSFRRGQQSVEQFSTSFGQMSRVTRVVAGDVAGSLNPALGEAVNALGAAAGAARGLGLAAGGVTVGLAIAGVGLSQYIQGLNAAAERQGALNLAVKAFDAGAVRTQLQQISAELETAASRRQGGLFDQAVQGLKDLSQAMGFTASSTQELARARAGLAQVLPLEREIALSQIFSKQDAALGALNASAAARASYEKNEAAFIVQHEKMAEVLGSEANEAERALKAQADLATRNALATNQGPAAIELINKTLREQIELLGIATLKRFEDNRLAKEQGILDIRSRRLPPIQADLQPAEGVPATAAELNALQEISVRTQQRMLAGALELNQAEQDRVEILTSVQGLSISEQEKLDELLGSERERLRILQAQLELQRLQADPSTSPAALQAAQLRVNNAQEQAAINARNRQQAVLERTDFGTGVQRGLRDTLDTFASEGEAGQQLVRGVASSIHQTFTDLLFIPLEQDWKKALIDIPKQLVGTLMRPFIDLAARQLTGGLIEGISKAFPALGLAGMTALGTGAVPGTAAASQLVSATTGQTQGALASLTGGQTLTVPPMAPSQFDLVGVNRLSGQSVFIGPGGQVIPMTQLDPLSLGIPDPSAGAGAGVVGSGAASSLGGFGAAFGGLSSLAALGSLVYSNLSTPQTGDPSARILTSAAGGALSGALAGVAIGTIVFPGIGSALGGFVGAVAGSFLGAGTAAAPKGSDPEVVAARNQGRSREAKNIYDQIVRAISQAGTIDQALSTPIHQFPPVRPGLFDPAPFAPRSAGPGLPPGVPGPPGGVFPIPPPLPIESGGA